MLRISLERTADTTAQTLLRLEGQITGPWVEELRRVTFDALGTNGNGGSRLTLDLAGVSFVGADGIALFRDLATRRVHFTNCSIFVAEQLKGVANVDR
jgi:anti-anti-sigma regulatory factor